MIEIIKKENYILRRIPNNIKKNYHFLIGLVILILLFIAIFQFYLYFQSNKILKISLKYDEIISNFDNSNFSSSIENLSNEKNFYGILASLDKIKILLKNNEIDEAYNQYLDLLNRNKLNNTYKSIIAIQAAYSLLDKTLISNKKESISTFINYQNKIINLTNFIDSSLESFEGYKLEILFLLSIGKQDSKNENILNNESKELYQKIQENDKITSSLKERVQKIHDFQKFE